MSTFEPDCDAGAFPPSAPDAEAVFAAYEHPFGGEPAQTAALLRDAPARRGRGPAERAVASGAFEFVHDADLHACHGGAAAEGVRRGASQGVEVRPGLIAVRAAG